MPSNSTVIASLEAQIVPEDQNCIRNAQDVVNVVQNNMRVVGLASQAPGSSLGTNNVAQQALETANQALAQVNTLSGQIPERRSNGTPLNLPTGDSIQAFTWAPPMPSAEYEVRITPFGPAAFIANFAWHVETASRTVSSVIVRFDNMPANCAALCVVEELP